MGSWTINIRTDGHFWSDEIFRIYEFDPTLKPAWPLSATEFIPTTEEALIREANWSSHRRDGMTPRHDDRGFWDRTLDPSQSSPQKLCVEEFDRLLVYVSNLLAHFLGVAVDQVSDQQGSIANALAQCRPSNRKKVEAVK